MSAHGDSSGRELARQVLVHGPIARADLGRRLGLSPASVTRLSRPLVERGIIVELPATSHGAHRPTRPLDVRVDAARFVGVKIQGDAALGVITSLRVSVLATASRPLASTAFDDVVAEVAALVQELDAASSDAGSTATPPLAGLGVSLGGALTADGTVARAPFLGWRDVPLVAALEAATGLPVTAENDVTALTVAEQWFGVFRDTRSFAVVTLGAGVGYGLVVNGGVVRTVNTALGLGGHVPLLLEGPTCEDGHVGCSTALLTDRHLAADGSARLGRGVTYDELLALAADGEPTAREITDRAGRALGRLLGYVTNLAMVDAVVLAGEGIALWDLVSDVALRQLAEDRDPAASPVEIAVDDSGFTAWARGAAALAISTALDTLVLSTARELE